MEFRKKQFLIKKHSPEQAMLTLQEFENKYQGFQSRWDFQRLSQKENTMTFQLVDHSYETPRGKGESDSPVYEARLDPCGEDVKLSWSFRWKRSKRILSWILLLLLLISKAMIRMVSYGDKFILLICIWMFCAILFGAWILQNVLHDRLSHSILYELLMSNFQDEEEENCPA